MGTPEVPDIEEPSDITLPGEPGIISSAFSSPACRAFARFVNGAPFFVNFSITGGAAPAGPETLLDLPRFAPTAAFATPGLAFCILILKELGNNVFCQSGEAKAVRHKPWFATAAKPISCQTDTNLHQLQFSKYGCHTRLQCSPYG